MTIQHHSNPTISPKITSCIALIILGVAALQLFVLRDFVLDDAFITFRYADNWAHGLGPTWQPPERVEGYSNFLWLVLCTAGIKAGFEPILLAHIAGILASAVTLFIIFRLGRIVFPDNRWAAVATVLWIATNAGFVLWGASGMETNLFALFVVLGAYIYLSGHYGSPHRLSRKNENIISTGFAEHNLRQSAKSAAYFQSSASASRARPLFLSGFIFGLASLTRPEGPVFFAATFLDLLIADLVIFRRGKRSVLGFRNLLYLCAGFFLCYLPHLFWRFSYYGSFLPNTYYAKIGVTAASLLRGIHYAGGLFYPDRFPAALAIIYAIFLARRDAGVRYLIFLTAAGFAFIVLAGGDAFGASRFHIPILGFIAILHARAAIDFAQKIFTKIKTRHVVLISYFLLVSVLSIYFTGHRAFSVYAYQKLFTHRLTRIGKWLRHTVPPSTLIAISPAGAIPYYSHLRAIDMLGLNDPVIARRSVETWGRGTPGHERGWGKYVLDRSPDIIFTGSVCITPGRDAGKQWRPIGKSEEEIWQDVRFREKYRRMNIRFNDFWLHISVRKSSPITEVIIDTTDSH